MDKEPSLVNKALIPAALGLSFCIFLYYLAHNVSANYYDEAGYIKIAHRILEFGVFNIQDSLRTYLYPTIVAGSLLVTASHLAIAKVLLSVVQYGVYVWALFYIAKQTFGVVKSEAVRRIVLVLGLLNPYLLQACSLYLTDSLATSLGSVALFTAMTGDLSRKRNVFLSFSLAYVCIMIRPASLIFFPMLLIITALRYGIGKTPWFTPQFVLINLASIGVVFFPQVYNNYVYFHILSALMPYNLYLAQVAYGLQFVKYGTVVALGEVPGLKYVNPFVPPINRITEIVHYVTPLNVAYAWVAHVAGALDWGYVDTYIRKFYPASRILGSLFLYPCWYFAAIAIPGALAPRDPAHSEEVRQLLRLTLISGAIYLAFIGTTQVESRFGYPVFMLFLPLMGVGMVAAVRSCTSRTATMTSALALATVVVVMFAGSFSFDLLTGRIFWYDHLKSLVSFRNDVVKATNDPVAVHR